jgi:AraC-like DNA-binding protein
MDALAYSQSANHNYSPTFVSSLCQNLIDIFLYHYTRRPSSDNTYNESILQTALIYINTHFASAITLGEIAAHAKCNATYLSEFFHKKMDMTIKQYINVMRIKQAKRLLITSDNSIMSICFECGFSSLASFNRNFLSVENMSPSAYRKAYTSKNPPKNMQ